MYKVQCILMIVYVIIINLYGVNVEDFVMVILFTFLGGKWFDSCIGNWIISNTRSITYLWFRGSFPGNQCLLDMSNREWTHCFLFCWINADMLCWARYDILYLVCFFLFFQLEYFWIFWKLNNVLCWQNYNQMKWQFCDRSDINIDHFPTYWQSLCWSISIYVSQSNSTGIEIADINILVINDLKDIIYAIEKLET